jgi:actin-related protein 8
LAELQCAVFLSRSHQASLSHPSKVLIVHPGSRILRIGRASDASPIDIPYCIARKLPREALPATEIPFSKASSSALDETKLENLRYDLKARMRILNLRGTTAGSTIAAEFNGTVQPLPVDDEDDEDKIKWTQVPESDPPAAYFGLEALHLPNPTKSGYKLRYPYRKGIFNTRDYTSVEELHGDIVDIWAYALEKLDIRAKDAEQYSVILLIPDRYSDIYVRHMCDLVLKTMGFAQLIVHQVSYEYFEGAAVSELMFMHTLPQEGLSASFAAGLPSACIIDIGAAKTSISCVDEGMVINDTRMVQGYGGDDITELFLQVAKTVQFPYKEADLSREYDWEVCQNLVQQCVAFNEVSSVRKPVSAGACLTLTPR